MNNSCPDSDCPGGALFLQLGAQVNASVHEVPPIPSDELGFQFFAQVAVVTFLIWLIEVFGSCCACGRRPAQLVYLASSILNSAGFTILLMVSLPFTQSLGFSEAASGILVSSNAVGGLAAQLLATRIIPEEAGSTLARIRRASAITLSGQALAHSGFVVSAFALTNVNAVWWSLIMCRILAGFFGALTNLTASLVALHMSPNPEVLNLQTASQACRNLGLCLGGFLSSLSLSSFKAHGFAMDRRRLGTVPVMYLTCLILVVLMINSFFVPNATAEEPPPEASPEPENPQQTQGAVAEAPQELDEIEPNLEKTKSIFMHSLLYNFERSFSTTAIEVATTMISIQDFGLTPERTGYIFGIITVGSVILNLAVGFTRSDLATRSFVMLLSAAGGIVFVAFLFSFWPFYFLYVGDVFLFMLSNTANGVVDGIGTLAAVPGSEYSKKKYMNQKMIAMATARIGAAPFVRGVIEMTNRDVYAALQLLLTLLGFRSAYAIYMEVNNADGK